MGPDGSVGQRTWMCRRGGASLADETGVRVSQSQTAGRAPGEDEAVRSKSATAATRALARVGILGGADEALEQAGNVGREGGGESRRRGSRETETKFGKRVPKRAPTDHTPVLDRWEDPC